MTTTTINPEEYRLEVEITEPVDPEYLQGRACYRMTATVTAAHNMPKAVFVHQRSQPIGVDGRVIDTFIGIAGPYDLVSLSESEPNEQQLIRKDAVSMLMTSPELAEDFRETIKEACQELIDSLSRLDTLAVTDRLTFIGPRQTTTTDTSTTS